MTTKPDSAATPTAHKLNAFEKYIEPLLLSAGPAIISDLLSDPTKKRKARKALIEIRDVLVAAQLD